MAATPKYKEMLIEHTRNGRSLGAPVTTPFTLTIMLQMFYSAIKEAKGVWELAPEKISQLHSKSAGEYTFANIIRKLQCLLLELALPSKKPPGEKFKSR